MSKTYRKEGFITDETTSVTAGVRQMKNDLKNKISNSPLAQEDSGNARNLALNLNRITENYELTLVVDDEVADKLDNAGNTKEDVRSKLETIFKSQRLVTIEYGQDTKEGFINQMNIDEKADEVGVFYKIKLRLLVSEDMTDDTGS